MLNASSQYLADDRELFAFLSGEQVGIPHSHGDILVSHELLQLHECDLAGLCQPGCEGMPHGVQGDGVQAVAVFRGQSELSDGGLEAGGRLGERRLLPRLLKDWLRRLAPVCLKHPNHIFRYPDEDSLSPFLNNVEAAGIGVHVLSTQLENLRGAKTGSQREQGHVMQLRMPLFKVIQKGLGLLSGQEAQPFVVGFDHRPCAASGGQGINAAPHAGGNGAVDGGAHEGKDVVHGLPGQSFSLSSSCGLALFGFSIPCGRFQELCLEVGEQIRSQLDYGQAMNFVLEMRRVLAIMLVNVFPLASAPGKIGINEVPCGHFFAFHGIDAGNGNFSKEFCPLFLYQGRTDALTVSADSFPMPLALGVLVAEAVNAIRQAGSWITFGGLAIEDALELGFDVFSAGYVAHEEIITANYSNWKMIIHLLSKRHFAKTSSDYNMPDLLIILAAMLATCEGERERERAISRYLKHQRVFALKKVKHEVAAQRRPACCFLEKPRFFRETTGRIF